MRHVRNFWVETHVDGGLPRGTGPRAADGGFVTRITWRDDGAVSPCDLVISGRVNEQGRLALEVVDGGETILYREVER